MRYLYGDSVPFPLGLDFLKTIDAFVSAASTAIRLEAEVQALEERQRATDTARTKALATLDQFHRTMMLTLRESSVRNLDVSTMDYARAITDTAVRFVNEATHSCALAGERDAASLRPEIERRHNEIQIALHGFFLQAPMPVVEEELTLRLAPDVVSGGTEPMNELSARLTYPANMVVHYALASDRVEEWRRPRRVSEFAHGLDLLVGARKSWFKKTVERDVVRLDEMFIGGFALAPDTAEIRLRKRPELVDTLVFRLARKEDDLLAEVLHPDDPDTDAQLPRALETQDRANVEKLWQMLRYAAMRGLAFRQRVLAMTLDGADPFSETSWRSDALIDRLVALLAPTLKEISLRSPNQEELSLKIESDTGAREELYLNKAILAARLADGPERAQALLVPLGLQAPDKGPSNVDAR